MDALTSRRQFLRLIALASTGSLLAACAQPAPAKPAELAKPAAAPAAPAPAASPAAAPAAAAPAVAKTGATISAATFSGPWIDGLNAGVVPCYKEKTGGNVELVTGTPVDFVQKIMATRDKPALDVIIGTDGDVVSNIELGVVEKLDPARVPNLAGILPQFKDPYEGYALGFDGGRNVLTYNSDKIKSPPASWVELTERIAKGEFGKAIMYPHITAPDSLAVSWLINRELGGTVTNWDPFFKRMKEMNAYILKFYTSNADPGTAMTRGEIDLAVWTDGRTYGVQAAGNKNVAFKLLAPGSPMLNICMMKVKNSQDAAWEYLNCAADPKNQALWNKFFPGYYMSHKDVEYVPESREKQDPTALDRTFKNWLATPWKDLAKARPSIVETWTKEIGA